MRPLQNGTFLRSQYVASKKGKRLRLPVIQFTVEKDKKHKRMMRPSFEDLKELIQELRSISKML